MCAAVDRIKKLIPELPKKDIALGYKFLKARDFESLQALVDSAIYKVRKDRKKETPKEEYLNINLSNLDKLKSEVDIYYFNLELPILDSEEVETQDFVDIDELYGY